MLQAKALAEELLSELRELGVQVRLLRQALERQKTTMGGE
jgi:hypothetical protein